MTENTAEELKLSRVQWLAQVYSNDSEALQPEVDAAHLFETMEGWGSAQFVESYRPLTKLVEARGPLRFVVENLRHVAADLSYADLSVDGEVLFVLYLRFEADAPHRLHYWNSYPPLPSGVTVRAYTPADAPGCVALERACPMELAGGNTWVIDRGDQFDSYLQLMGKVDAAVLVAEEEGQDKIVGFYSCALRPIHFNDVDTHCVYQHHYRVHPDYRAGSVSQALAAFVDPRRSFESEAPQFPYAMIDPKNVHMRNMGFPGIDGITIARLSLPLSTDDNGTATLSAPSSEEICQLLNTTHHAEVLYKQMDEQSLLERCSLIDGYGQEDFHAMPGAVMGIWRSGERNILTYAESGQSGSKKEEVYHLAFALDYGFTDTNSLLSLLDAVGPALVKDGVTHLCFLCDTRASEFAPLSERASDIERFGFHTLPFLAEAFQSGTIYCDGVYC